MQPADSLARRVTPALARLVAGLAAVVVGIAIPMKIGALGYLPTDDCVRHVAKAVSGREWPDILLLRPGLTIDHNAGWHAILATVHRHTGWDADQLAFFSVALLCSLFLVVPLFANRRPAAWLLALLLLQLCWPTLTQRLLLGRPYLWTMTVVVLLLEIFGQRCDTCSAAGLMRRWIVATLLIASSVWIHGAWYLFALAVAAHVLALRLRAATTLAAAWVAGSLLGASLTGQPLAFLIQQVQIGLGSLQSGIPSRILVGEFLPAGDTFRLVVLVWLILAVSVRRGESIAIGPLVRDPAFVLAVIAWLLGLKVQRVLLDWGMPALAVWTCRSVERFTARECTAHPARHVAVTLAAAAGLFLSTTSDLGSRWTSNLKREYLSRENPEQAAWLPDPGGVLYSSDMTVFYDTFYKNPTAPWRYVLGYEPSLMPPEDLATYIRIRWNFNDARAFLPWVARMEPADRLVVRSRSQPDLPALEWHYAATETWIGRLPRER